MDFVVTLSEVFLKIMHNENQSFNEKTSPDLFVSLDDNPKLPEENQKTKPIFLLFWWIRIGLTAMISLFFLFWGIETLSGAYSLKNPLEFIMFFFSASFVILLSSVGIVFTFVKIYGRFKWREK